MVKARKNVVMVNVQDTVIQDVTDTDKADTDKAHLIEILGAVQGHLCAYNIGTGPTNFCDCKYAQNTGSVGGPSEQGNGCPEVRKVISILTAMSDVEYKRISARTKEGKK
jgi:hypothetical protein